MFLLATLSSENNYNFILGGTLHWVQLLLSGSQQEHTKQNHFNLLATGSIYINNQRHVFLPIRAAAVLRPFLKVHLEL